MNYDSLNIIIMFCELCVVIVLGGLNVWILVKLNNQSIETTKLVNQSNEKFTKELNEQNAKNQENLFEQNKNIMLYEHRIKTLEYIFYIYNANMYMQGIQSGIENSAEMSNSSNNEAYIKLLLQIGSNLEKEDEVYYKIKSSSEILFDNEIMENAENLYNLNASRRIYFHENQKVIINSVINMEHTIKSFEEMNNAIYNSSVEMQKYLTLNTELIEEVNKFEKLVKTFITKSVK